MNLQQEISKTAHGSLKIGRTVRMLRKKKEMTQSELGEKAHLSRCTINALETGRYKTITLGSLQAVSSTLEVSLKDLLSSSDTPLPFEDLKKGKEASGEFVLDYPDSGFKIVSWLPRGQEFFLGNIFIRAKSEITNGILPHAELLFFETVKGNLLVSFSGREIVLKEREYLFFDGRCPYRLYNPHPLDEAKLLVTTFPSFL